MAALGLLIIGIATGCKQNEAPVGQISPPDLQLVSAGNEPRRVLRYHAAAGSVQKLGVRIAVELTAGEMGGPMPTLGLSMSYAVTAVLPTGQMTLRATIDKVSANDTPGSKVPAAALAGPLETLQGLAITSVLSPNGRLTGSKLDSGTKTLAPELQQQIQSLIASFESTMMALPDEAVGVGAVWRNSRPVEQNGLKLVAINSVSLTAIKGDVIEYTIDTDIHGQDQSTTQDGVTIEVKDIIGNGGGKGSIDLGKLAITSELAAEFRSEMTATGDPSPTKMEMATLMNVRPL